MSKVPDWFNDSDFDVEPIVIFKTETIHFLTFLNEGIKGKSKIEIKDNLGKVIETKEVPCVEYLVNENNDKKKFNPISKQLIGDLKLLFPLTDKTFRIELIKGRTSFENKYKITELEA